MSKKYSGKSKSTKLFISLAKRSFDANWKYLQSMYREQVRDIPNDIELLSPLIISIIGHVGENFEMFIEKEGKKGCLNEVNIETVAEALVGHSARFRV